MCEKSTEGPFASKPIHSFPSVNCRTLKRLIFTTFLASPVTVFLPFNLLEMVNVQKGAWQYCHAWMKKYLLFHSCVKCSIIFLFPSLSLSAVKLAKIIWVRTDNINIKPVTNSDFLWLNCQCLNCNRRSSSAELNKTHCGIWDHIYLFYNFTLLYKLT